MFYYSKKDITQTHKIVHKTSRLYHLLQFFLPEICLLIPLVLPAIFPYFSLAFSVHSISSLAPSYKLPDSSRITRLPTYSPETRVSRPTLDLSFSSNMRHRYTTKSGNTSKTNSWTCSHQTFHPGTKIARRKLVSSHHTLL